MAVGIAAFLPFGLGHGIEPSPDVCAVCIYKKTSINSLRVIKFQLKID
jgi:hypothetical protein